MLDTLLMILNPRDLPECVLSLRRLDVPKVWLKNYTELQLEAVIPGVIDSTDYEYYAVISDDCVVSRDAYEYARSLRSPDRVSTGYCNLDTLSDHASLTQMPFPITETPVADDYFWYTLREVANWPTVEVPTHFAGMSFTVMHRDMWHRFPWQVYGRHAGGWAADTNLAQRLHAQSVPIVAHKWSMIYHTKPNWLVADNTDRRRLYVGVEAAEVVYDV